MEPYDIILVASGVAVFATALLPRMLSQRPLSMPLIHVALGMALFTLPVGLDPPNPLRQDVLTERLAELAVIVSLMGVGLRIDRPVGWRSWQPTWRLLALTMPATIAACAMLGHWLLGLAPATAMLLGAVIAPTDPVLASDVQVGPPGSEPEDEVRLALTSEAGLNDGLAFPFSYAAVAMATAGAAPGGWLGDWLLVDVGYRVAAGVGLGFLAGRLLAHLAFSERRGSSLARTMEGSVALAITLTVYGVTELAHGYGFIAVFVAALTLRSWEREHSYHAALHDFVDGLERLLVMAMLLLLGGAVVGGLLAPLGWPAVLAAVAIVLFVRPLAGTAALAGTRLPPAERAAVGFFGIRGVGSIYYLAWALNHAEFDQAELVWAGG